jgi:hypothetical protein
MSHSKILQKHGLGKVGDYDVRIFFLADQICTNSLFSCSSLEANPLTIMLSDAMHILAPLCLPISVMLTSATKFVEKFPDFVLPFPVIYKRTASVV